MKRKFLLALMVLLLISLACGKSQESISAIEESPSAHPPQEDVAEPTDPPVNISPGGDQPMVEGALFFEEDFQDGKPDRWEITSAWDVQQLGDAYTFESQGAGGAWVPEGSAWSNYSCQVMVRIDAGSLLLGINVSQSGRYLVRLDGNGLYLIKESPLKNYTVVSRTGPVSLGDWHQLELASFNGRVQVYVDQALWVDYQDSTPLSKGTITVTSQDGSQVAIDDVLVMKTGPLPDGVVQAPPPPDTNVELDMGDGGQVVVEPDAGIQANDQPGDDQQQDQNQAQADELEEQQGDQQPQAGGLPDLVIVEATFDPNPAVSGQQFLANYVISNQGDAPSGAFTLLWKFHAATGMGVCSWDYDTLAPGETVWGGCPRMTNAEPGQSPTTLTVDFEGEIVESNEDNNVLTPTLSLITTAQDEPGEAEPNVLPDLVVGAMAYTDRNFRCELVNYGQGTAPAGARVTLFVNGNKIDWQETATPLPSGGSITFNIPVDLAIEEINKARCIADRGNSIEEENEDNNEFVWVQE